LTILQQLSSVAFIGIFAVVGLTFITHRRTGMSPILIIGGSISAAVIKTACAVFAFAEATDNFFRNFVQAYRENKERQNVSAWSVVRKPIEHA
jgi:hypothetical protein